MKEFFKRGENISALILFIAFFLPWVDLGIVSLPGYKLIKVGEGLASLASSLGEKEASLPSEVYLIYLIPVVSLIIMYMGLKGKRAKLLSIVLGALILLGFVLYFVDGGSLEFFGLGLYLTFLGAVGLILGALDIFKLNLS